MAKSTIVVSLDANPIMSSLAELSELPLEVGERFFRGLEAGLEFCRVESDFLPAPGASHLRVRFEPADFLIGLVATARAGN